MIKLDLISAEHKVESRYESSQKDQRLEHEGIQSTIETTRKTEGANEIFPATPIPTDSSPRFLILLNHNFYGGPCAIL